MTTTTKKTKAQARGKAATKGSTPKAAKRAPTRKEAATEPRPSKGQTPTGEPRAGSKQAQLIAMLRRPEGATISGVTEAFNWQAHTARAVISTLAKRLGAKVEAERKEGVMVYRLPPA